jgi:dTDP-4-amino-4,6-dideoxygalactose transaminase
MVKFVNLSALYADIPYQEITTVVHTAQFIGAGDFEKKFTEYNECKYCIGVGSGLDALWLSLIALGIGPGDEVIVPANTYIATAFAVSHVGAAPIFADVDPNSYVLTVDDIDAVRTKKTRAIIPVHLYGQPCDMKSITDYARANNLLVIEDCAQAAGASIFGKKVGTFGDVGCFSFYPTKNLGGLGQGGAIITCREDVAKVTRELGNVGREEGSWYDYKHIGFNSRLDAINAKFLESNLGFLDQWNARRIEIANQYETQLDDLNIVFTPLGPTDICIPVFHLYELKVENKQIRDALAVYLKAQSIETGLHYPIICPNQPVYRNLEKWYCPNADMLADCLISLPMHPKMTTEEVSFVCKEVHNFFIKR